MIILQTGTKVVCGGGDGTLSIYSWGRWGDISDRFPGHPTSIDAVCKVNENILVTGDADGKIRYNLIVTQIFCRHPKFTIIVCYFRIRE